MRKSIVRGGLITAFVSVAVTAVPAAAFAAGSSASCTTNVCSVSATGFPGGTISVDADVSGSGTGFWTLTGPNGFSCRISSFPASGGVRSWTCANAPRGGTYIATVGGPAGPSKIGIRW